MYLLILALIIVLIGFSVTFFLLGSVMFCPLTACPTCSIACDWTDNYCSDCGTSLPHPSPETLTPEDRALFEYRFNKMKEAVRVGGDCWRNHEAMRNALPEVSESVKKSGGVVGGKFCPDCGEEISRIVV